MQIEKIHALWNAYTRYPVSRVLHPQDDMFNKAKNGWDDYELVGRSAAKVITATLYHARTERVDRVLDFGCGHGRVARHLRAMFPEAELHFADIDRSGVEFCASTFHGLGTVSSENLATVVLPKEMDLVWVGSVFTHLDYGRMITLWDKLFESLRVDGMLIATFRGAALYRRFKRNPEPYYNNMVFQYESIGIGYQDYKDFTNWGQSLVTFERCTDLARRHPLASLIGYTETGWANVHDVASWTRRADS